VSYVAPATYAAQQYTGPVIPDVQKCTAPVIPDVQNNAMKASPCFQDFTLVDLCENQKSMSIYLGKPTVILNCATL
jgi:hypothetical protein